MSEPNLIIQIISWTLVLISPYLIASFATQFSTKWVRYFGAMAGSMACVAILYFLFGKLGFLAANPSALVVFFILLSLSILILLK